MFDIYIYIFFSSIHHVLYRTWASHKHHEVAAIMHNPPIAKHRARRPTAHGANNKTRTDRIGSARGGEGRIGFRKAHYTLLNPSGSELSSVEAGLTSLMINVSIDHGCGCSRTSPSMIMGIQFRR